MSPESMLCVGMDWGRLEQAVCVTDEAGDVVWRGRAGHSGQSLRELVEHLTSLVSGELGRLQVGLERPDGVIVSTMLDAGIPVSSINPQQMSAFRSRYSSSGAKDDERDALLLSRVLRTDGDCFRKLSAVPAEVTTAGRLARMHGSMTKDMVALSNQVKEVLFQYYPQFLEAVPSFDRPWAFDLWRKAKTPEAAKKLRKPWVESLLRRHRARSSAEAILTALKQESVKTLPGEVEMAALECGYLMDRLELTVLQLKAVDRSMGKAVLALEELGAPGPDQAEREEIAESPAPLTAVKILRSMPGAGPLTVCTLMSEAYWAIEAQSEMALRALCGTAPVTVQSGKSLQVKMRKSCSSRLRHVVHHWAKAAIQKCEELLAVFARAKARGCRTGAAYRRVADKLLNIYIALLRKGELFDPDHQKPKTASEVTHT